MTKKETSIASKLDDLYDERADELKDEFDDFEEMETFKFTKIVCPECGSRNVVLQGHCFSCNDCGFSLCDI